MFSPRKRHLAVVVLTGVTLLFTSLFFTSPVVSQDSPQIIEAEDQIYIRHSGIWSQLREPSASGAAYMVSTENPADTLTLRFSGTYLEIVYPKSPTLGLMTVELDGTILANLMLTGDHTSFGARTIFDDLSDSNHVVRIYPANGRVAIDAFVVQQVIRADANVSGTVIDDSTGLPIVNLEIAVGGVGSTCTDSNGDYDLDVPYEQDFYVLATGSLCSGGAPIYIWEYWEESRSYDNRTTLNIPSVGPNLTGIDFTLDPGTTISGNVIDQNTGLPLENIYVHVQGDGWGRAGCTDADGNYTVDMMPHNEDFYAMAGGYHLCGFDPSGVHVREVWEETPDGYQGTPIHLNYGDPAPSDIDFTLEEGLVISGTVYDQDTGTGLPVAIVYAELGDRGIYSCANWSGLYGLVAPFDTEFRMHATGERCDSSQEPYLGEYWQEVPGWNSAIVFNEPPGTPPITGIDFTLTQGATVSGTVTDQETGIPLQNVFVGTFGFPSASGLCTDANGNYGFTIPYDTNFFIGSDGTFCDGSPSSYLPEYWQEQSNYNDADWLSVPAGGADLTGIDLTLEQGATVSGRIVDQDTGLGIPNLNVNTHADGWGSGACTDADGYYTLTNIPYDSDFRVGAGGFYTCTGSDGEHVYEFYGETFDWGQATVLNIPAGGADLDNIDISLEHGVRVTGLVTDQGTSDPLPNMSISIEYVDGWGMGACGEYDGTYGNVLPYNEPFRIRARGSRCDGQPSDYLHEYWQETLDWNSAVVFDVSPGDPDLTGIDFTLEHGATVSGHVYDQNTGQPLVTMQVGISFDGWGDGNCTDQNGYYEFTVPYNTDFRVNAGGPNGCTGGLQGYQQEWWQEASSYNDATILNIAPGESPLTDIDFTLEEGVTVSGRVVDQDTGLPLANFSVGADFDGWGNWVCTDQDGYYTMTGIPYHEDFIVHASGWICGDGQSGYVEEYWEETPRRNEAVVFNLSPGDPDPTGIDFTLEEGAFVRGTIIDQVTGLPIPNMNVSADLSGYGFGACTNQNGEYGLVVPYDQDFRVNTAFGWNWCGGSQDYLEEYWEETPNWDDATILNVPSGDPDLDGINFTLETGATVSGRVIDQNTGLPIANVQVGIWWGGYIDDRNNNVCTDANGEYTIEGVRRQTDFYVSAGGDNMCGNASYVMEWYEEAGWIYASTILNIPPSSPGLNDIDFTLEAGMRVSGQVVDQETGLPLSGMRVTLHNYSDWWDCTDSNGNYQFLGIAYDTDFTVEAGGPPWWCGGSWDYIAEWWQEAVSQAEAAVLNFSPGSPDLDYIDFTLESGGTVSGIITDEDTGLLLEGIAVEIYSEDRSFSQVECTNENGEYFFSPVPKDTPLFVRGAYPYADWCQGPTNYVQEWWQEASSPATATPIMVTDSILNLTGIDLTLIQGGSISGRVVASENSSPLPDVWICAWDYTAPHWNTAATSCGQTDANGDYTIRGLSPTAKRLWAVGITDRLRLFYRNMNNYEHAMPVQVIAGGNTSGVNFSLPRASLITGRITGPDGGPPNALVTVSTSDGQYPNCSAADGNYRIMVPVGTHEVMASGDGFCDDADFPVQYWDHVPVLEDATSVNVPSLGIEVSDINFDYDFSPHSLNATPMSGTRIDLDWVDHSNDETAFHLERSTNGVDFAEIGTAGAGVTTYSDSTCICETRYWYRVRAFNGQFSGYSNIATAISESCEGDTLALFNTDFNYISLLDVLLDWPTWPDNYNVYVAGTGILGQWVMGDWDGDGQQTPGVFTEGAFFYTNQVGETPHDQWLSIWLGPTEGYPIAGNWNGGSHDCIGLVVDNVGLWWTCEMTTTVPTMGGQWLGGQLSTYPGEYQFAAGDWDGDGVDTVAIRRDKYITWTNIHVDQVMAEFTIAQYIGEPGAPNYGILVDGDWNNDGIDSFGLFYNDGWGSFYRREDLDWNSGVYILQHVGQPIGDDLWPTSWRDMSR